MEFFYHEGREGFSRRTLRFFVLVNRLRFLKGFRFWGYFYTDEADYADFFWGFVEFFYHEGR